MLRRTLCSHFSVPNFKGKNVGGVTGSNTAIFNRNRSTLNSAKVPRKGMHIGRGQPGSPGMLRIAKGFGETTIKTPQSRAASHEFVIQASPLDRLLQHLIISLQKQINHNAKRDPPQRHIHATVAMHGTSQASRHAMNPALTWVDAYKPIDTGYTSKDADAMNENRDEVLFRVKRHFHRRRVQLTLDEFSEEPPGFSCQLKWYAEDDHYAVSPEGTLHVPRVDWAQRTNHASRIGIGHGLHRTAL
ncbi:hypothetical protein DIPPA_59542 [Diplonema papillatum]|nr:hypothetical protein DIPPA_59542 [Diplonema papillatum]